VKYRYYISFNGTDYSEFTPLGHAKLTTEKDEAHNFYRTKCSNIVISYKFSPAIYATLESYFEDNTKFQTQLYYKIYRGDSSTGTLVFSGFSSVNDGKLDKDLGRFEIEPRIDDSYQDFLDSENRDFEVLTNDCFSWTKEVCYFEKENYGNFSNGSSPNDYDTFSGSDCISYYLLSADSVEDEFNERRCYKAMTRNSLINDFVIIQVTAFTLGTGEPPYCEIRSGETHASCISNTVQITPLGKYILRLTGNASNANIVFFNSAGPLVDWDITCYIKYSQTSWQFTNAGLTLKEFTTSFITDSDCMNLSYSGKVKSTFLWQDALPTDKPSSISSWITSNANGNYVSLTTGANILNNVLILSKPRMYDTKSGSMTFSKFMDYLFTMLRCYWYIDEDGNFRIEHVKYFNKKRVDSTGINLTSGYDQFKPLADKHKFKLLKEQMFNCEQVEWQVSSRNQTAPYMDFVGFDITYSKLETSQNVKRWDLSEVCNDFRFMINYPAEAPDSGFALAECESFTSGGSTFYEIKLATGAYTGTSFIPNVNMSQANLQESYWTWDRYAGSGYINAGAVTFDGTVGLIPQDKVKFPYSSTIDPYAKITTDKGGGAVVSIERDLNTDFITVDLLHDAY